MQPSIVSFDGTNINDSVNYEAFFPANSLYVQPQSKPTIVKRPGYYPVVAGITQEEKRFVLNIKMLQVLHEQIGTLNELFSTRKHAARTLIFEDTADGNKQYQVDAWPIAQPKIEGQLYRILLVAADWPPEAVNSSTDTDNNVATTVPYSFTVTPGGNTKTYPTITFDPQSDPNGGYGYIRYGTVYNQTDNALPDYAIEITGGGLDTATLVGAGKMQADGDDLRVFVGGVEVDRWIQDINTASTQVWIVLPFRAKWERPLEGAIGSGDTVTAIQLPDNTTSRDFLRTLPFPGIVQINNEQFSYSYRNPSTRQITGVTRAVRGTTAANHSDNDTIRYIQHDIQVVYGNTAVSAPVVDDNRKPMFDISDGSDSTNDLWVYADFREQDVARPAAWQPVVEYASNADQQQTGIYTADQFDYADPASEMGLLMSSWQANAVWNAEDASLYWQLYQPCGVDEIAAQGEVYEVGSLWPAAVGIFGWDVFSQRELLDIDNAPGEWTGGPSSESTWDGWETASYSPAPPVPQAFDSGNDYTYIALMLRGNIGAGDGNTARIEASDVHVSVANKPSVTLGGENGGTDTYHLLGTLTHDDEGISFDIDIPMLRADSVVIDCENLTVKLNNDNLNIIGAIKPDTARADWMYLNGGETNNFTWDSDDGGENVDIDFEWRDRQT